MYKYICRNKWKPAHQDIIETIRFKHPIYQKFIYSDCLWDVWSIVIDINGMKIGFEDAKCTGVDSPEDLGYDFDESKIAEVIAKQKLQTYYVNKSNENI